MGAPVYAVTFDTRSDESLGLRRMSLREAAQLIDFAELRGMVGARIIPVGHSPECSCFVHSGSREVTR